MTLKDSDLDIRRVDDSRFSVYVKSCELVPKGDSFVILRLPSGHWVAERK